MKNYSDNGETLYGAYGYRLRKFFDLDQLTHAYNTLSKLPETRQVVLQIWDCTSDFPRLNGEPVSKDIPCNLLSHLLVRDGKLHWLQVMRSNDLVWGTPYNFIQWTMLQEVMAGWLGLEVGPYTHVSDSLHIYKRHWNSEDVDLVERAYKFPENTDKFNFSHNESALCFHTLWKFSREITSDNYIPSKQYARVTVNRCKLPDPYKNIAVVLMTEVLHKERNLADATEFLKENCTNPAYVELQLAWMNRRK